MSVTAKDLAKELRLSEAAVSMALNGKPGVSTATRKRVVETAKRMGYDFSRVGEPSLSSPVQGTITFIIYRRHGAIVSDTPFFSQLSEGIDSACRKLGYHLNICYLYLMPKTSCQGFLFPCRQISYGFVQSVTAQSRFYDTFPTPTSVRKTSRKRESSEQKQTHP